LTKTGYGKFPTRECWHSRRQPLVTTLFFVSFVIIGAFIMLSFFIGAVTGGMSQAMDEFDEKEERDRREHAEQAYEEMHPNGALLKTLRDFFDLVDVDGSGEVDKAELAASMKAMGESEKTIARAAEMIHKVDRDGSNTMSFREFVLVVTLGELDLDREEEEQAMRDEADPFRAAARRAVLEDERLADAAVEATLLHCLQVTWQPPAAEEAVAPTGYLALAAWAKRIVFHPQFTNFMTGVILTAAFLVGVRTEISYPGRVHQSPFLDGLEILILILFAIEVVLKLIAEGYTPHLFFTENWNRFDFAIVALCLIFLSPALPNMSGILSVLRLLRLLKVARSFPELRVLIDALIAGVSSIFFILVILWIFFYIYAIIGVSLLGTNDPQSFAHLGTALLTLVRMVTFDNWSDVLFVSVLGCNNFGYSNGRAKYGFTTRVRHKVDKANCNHAQPWGWVAVAYFVSFGIIGGQVLMVLFIGVVCTSMEDAKASMEDEFERRDRLNQRFKALGLPQSERAASGDGSGGLSFTALLLGRGAIEKDSVDEAEAALAEEAVKEQALREERARMEKAYREIFDVLDDSEGSQRIGHISREAVKRLVPCLPAVQSELASGLTSAPLTRADIEMFFEVMAMEDSFFGNKAHVEFPEFVVAMEFVRQSVFIKGVVNGLREAFKISTQIHKPTPAASAQDQANKMQDMFSKMGTGSEAEGAGAGASEEELMARLTEELDAIEADAKEAAVDFEAKVSAMEKAALAASGEATARREELEAKIHGLEKDLKAISG
jgi:voltage-gated sodium channel